MEASEFKIPKELKEILSKDSNYELLVNNSLIIFQRIIKEGDHFFFDEYTNHGIAHINEVLNNCNGVITDDSKKLLNSKNVAVLIISVAFHDIGMCLNLTCFNDLISKSNKFKVHSLDKTTYFHLWNEYLLEFKHWTDEQKLKVFGKLIEPKQKNQYEKEDITTIEKKFIGEFIRRHHPRIAHDLAINYYPGINNQQIDIINLDSFQFLFEDVSMTSNFKEVCGLIARSHGMDFRYINEYLKKIDSHNWMDYLGVKTTYLMAVIRIADYFLIDSKRVTSSIFLFKEFYSPISLFEFKKHLSIVEGVQSRKDTEAYRFILKRIDSNEVYISLKKLFESIQNELDKTWAILGEAYSLYDDLKQLKLKYRRISSNIFDSSFGKDSDIVFGEAKIKFNSNLLPLLSRTIYLNKSASLRELIQNSVDACKIRKSIEIDYHPKITIEYNNQQLEISDNGVGMNLKDINHYFLNVGKSSKIEEYKYEGIAGKFGIGFLASFILGDEATVSTKKYNSEVGFEFKVNIKDELKNNITIYKNQNIEIGTRVAIPINLEDIENLKNDIVNYFDYCGDIEISNNLGLNFSNFKFRWRNVEDENFLLRWNYRIKTKNFKLKKTNNYLNDFFVKEFKFNHNDDAPSVINRLVFSFVDKKNQAILNLSRENGFIYLTSEIMKKLQNDFVIDLNAFLLSLKEYETVQRSPSEYHPLLRSVPQNLIVYTIDGYNLLSNLDISPFEYILHSLRTIRHDIKLLEQLPLEEAKKILLIYSSTGIDKKKLKYQYRTFEDKDMKEHDLIFNFFNRREIFRINKAKEIFSFCNSKEKCFDNNFPITQSPFYKKIIPYKREDRKIKFQNFHIQFQDRINDMSNWRNKRKKKN